MNPRFTCLAIASLLAFATSCKSPYLHPPGLGLGEKYHLVFVTAGTRNGASSSIGDYNTFVQQQAEASELSLPSTTWKAIASTASESAVNNVGTGSGPVYLIDASTLVSNSVEDLFNGTNLQAAIDTTQNGNVIPSFNFAWTGTGEGGVSANPLGSSQPERGDLRTTNGDLWLTANNSLGSSGDQPLYAISAPITVTSVNPIPDLSCLFALGSIVCIGMVVVSYRRQP